MKWFPRILLLFLVPALQAQDLGRAQGFPADPVISASFFDDSLYLGTQGAGVYVLKEDVIIPSKRFKEFSQSSVYGFDTVDKVATTKGIVLEYPIIILGDFGIQYIVTDGNLKIKYSDAAQKKSNSPSGIWSFSPDELPLFPDGVYFIRSGNKLETVAYDGSDLNTFTSRGLIFDVAYTEKGLLLSTETGIFRWREGWKSFYTGLPVFKFDGVNARTPLGSISLSRLLSGKWSIGEFKSLLDVKETHSEYYDIDTLGGLWYGFHSGGIDVFDEEGIKYTLDEYRELPPLRPGNYDVAIIQEELLVATPMGLWSFNRQGNPSEIRGLAIEFTENGLKTESLENLEVEPASIGFTTSNKKTSSARIHGRYRINNDPWNAFTPGDPILFVRPAPGSYTLDIQTSHRLDFKQSTNAHYEYQISAWWYKRPLFWSIVIILIASGIWYRQRNAKIQIQEKLELQERLADAELASKRLQMNPHFLFNALDAISNFIFKNQPKDAVQYMGKLAKMMRLTLDSSRSVSVVVADEKELIEKYLDLCILRYGTFKTSVEVDDDLDPYDYHVPPMLVQPLVENAVQHAIRPLLAEGKEGSIRVQFSLQGPSVQITITDNGSGFDPAQKASKSHGLAIIEERLHLLSKKYGGEFSLHCNRLGEEHSPDGMQVSLILTMENDG